VASTAADSLGQDLQRRIFAGEFAPGAPLREAELTARYGAGRHTVRAALRELIARGLVKHDPHRSARVRELTADDIRDLYAVRRVVELEALRRLVDDDAPLVALEEAVARREAVEPESGDGYTVDELDADLDFHRALVHSVGSERLSRTFETLANELRLAFLAFIADPGDRGDHRPILDAVRARDLARATELLDRHIRDGLRLCLAAAS
jgi:DNA-binding GntR family transcriptional regulator